MKTILVTVSLIFFLVGCQKDDEKIQTVEWYLDHETERTAKLKECHNNPGALEDTANCINANSAAVQLSASAGSLENLKW